MLQEKTKLELILRVCACAHPLIERLITEFTSTARTCTLPDNCSHTHTNATATHTRLYARIIYRWIQLWLVCVQQYHDCWWLRGVSCIPALLWDANTGQHWAKVPSEGRPFPISARNNNKNWSILHTGSLHSRCTQNGHSPKVKYSVSVSEFCSHNCLLFCQHKPTLSPIMSLHHRFSWQLVFHSNFTFKGVLFFHKVIPNKCTGSFFFHEVIPNECLGSIFFHEVIPNECSLSSEQWRLASPLNPWQKLSTPNCLPCPKQHY